MKAIKEKLPEDQKPAFEKGAATYAKKIVANFKDYDFVRLLFVFLVLPIG